MYEPTIPNLAELRAELKAATISAWEKVWADHRDEEIYAFGIDTNDGQYFLPVAVSEEGQRSLGDTAPHIRWEYALSALNRRLEPFFDRTNELLEASNDAAMEAWEQKMIELEEQDDFSTHVPEPFERFHVQAYDLAIGGVERTSSRGPV